MKNIFQIVVIFMIAFSNVSLAQNESPNILFIGVDDMADWVGCMDGYPGKVHTPNIDRLANRGILFTNAHCTSPICGPSRAAILTGLRPETSGVYHNLGHYNDYTDAVGFPLYFRQNGYTSLGAGKINHGYGREIYENWDDYGPDTKHIGGPVNEEEMSIEGMDPTKYIKRFDVNLPQNPGALVDRPFNKYSTWDYCAFDIPDSEMPDGKIALWGVDQLQKKHNKPFLIACGFYRPHQPFYVPKKYFDMYDLDEVVLPETIAGDMFDIPTPGINLAHGAWSSGKHETCIKYNQWKPLIRGYLAAISFADAQVGKLVDALDYGQNAENTWIVLFSDHGWHLGEKEHWGKHTPWRNSTRVPFIIVPPQGKTIGDFNPGTKCNQPVNLVDIYPTLVEMANFPQKEGLSGKSLIPLIENPNADWDEATVTTIAHGNHAIHTEKWSYIHYYDGSEELYNIEDDPEEWVNLANVPEHKPLIEKLKKYIPEDRYKQFVRYNNWKVCFLHSGEMELYEVTEGAGIAEQVNVAESNSDVVYFIQDYMKRNNVSATFYNIEIE
ncbi:MAG: sulfatase [Prolixibacteraceae bacterium]|jgi:arylsulfatase A-like enzyme|nr:sulfatase [Prolixibacteraceae bacterium]MBT7394174.1 sulfatase [Prolixibacteraceae bacterium]